MSSSCYCLHLLWPTCLPELHVQGVHGTFIFWHVIAVHYCWIVLVKSCNFHQNVSLYEFVEPYRQKYVAVRFNFAVGQTMKALKEREVCIYSFCNLGARWGWVVSATPRPSYSRERTPGIHCTENLDPSPSPALRVDPRTVQQVTSRCTDFAVLAHSVVCP